MRPTLDEYFMSLAKVVASRSTCLHHIVGAVLVKDKRLLCTGYNGAPTGMAHCTDIGCAREGMKSGERAELCRAVHAEQSAIVQAAVHGISIAGATIYCTHQPCNICSKLLLNAGIKRVVFAHAYADIRGLELLAAAGIKVEYVGD
jgi:dCMP deaminase